MNILKLPFFAESWNVAYRRKEETTPFLNKNNPFIVIKNSFRYWAADPFLFERGDAIYIFAELYDYVLCRGVIGYYKLNDKKPKWIPIIQEKFHLSYPCIYESDDKIFILPETSKNETLYCYRAVDFPKHWVKEKPILKNVKLVDTTPFSEYDYKLALTYDLSDSSLKLVDFSRKTIKSVARDTEGIKRPAGYMSAKGIGIRVAQDCSQDYGKGIVIYCYTLSEDRRYSENIIKKVYPKDVTLTKKLYLDGMHTYNQSRLYEVIDIKTRRFNLLNFIMRLLRLIKRKL